MTYREFLKTGGNPTIYRVCVRSGVSCPTIRRAKDGESISYTSAEKILRAIHFFDRSVEIDDAALIAMCEGTRKRAPAGGEAAK
jgi:hypothetical protein